MSLAGALHGLRIAVTRPLAQADGLATLIATAGGTPLSLPLLEIAAVADTRPLARAATILPGVALAIFISPNAVEYALPTLLAAAPWPPATRPAAVGPGTARALQARGVRGCLVPSAGYDSESLLALHELQEEAVVGRKILIFRGDGGRELLAETLAARGAEVEAVSCYRRSPPAAGFGAWEEQLAAGGIDAVTASSSEGLRHLCAGVGAAGLTMLRELPLFVPHPRIAATAKTCGMRRIVLTEAADAGIFAALCAYNWPRS